MRTKLFILTLAIIHGCAAQDAYFEKYISNFRVSKLPIMIDGRNYGSLFFPKGAYKEIPIAEVKRFLCQDSSRCPFDPVIERFDYGIRLQGFQGIEVTLIHKQHFEGTTEDFDLAELILVTYTLGGQLIDQMCIAKDNDNWVSFVDISTTGVRTIQVKLVGPPAVEMSGDVQEYTYKISREGNINLVNVGPSERRLITWNDSEKCYKVN